LFVLSRPTYKAMAAQENNLWVLVGNVEDVRAALQAGGDPNTSEETGKTFLMCAIMRGKEEVVNLLLEQPSIEVNAKDDGDNTALHWACAGGNVAILNQLLAVPGILVNERERELGWTPIMAAIDVCRLDIVRVMAAVEKVDLDVRDDRGLSLEDLAYRCHYGEIEYLEIVAILGEERQRREERKRLVREQKNRVGKVLLEGIYDEDSLLHKLRSPNNAVEHVMPILWGYLTGDWQVYDENQA